MLNRTGKILNHIHKNKHKELQHISHPKFHITFGIINYAKEEDRKQSRDIFKVLKETVNPEFYTQQKYLSK